MTSESNGLAELEGRIKKDIPLARHLGLSLASYDGACITLNAPLDGNSNHRDTAFAGSLDAVATLAGWSLMSLMLKELGVDGEVVIQNCTVSFVRPVTADFSARCWKPAAHAIADFAAMLLKRGRARMELEAIIGERLDPAVRFFGRYVAILKD